VVSCELWRGVGRITVHAGGWLWLIEYEPRAQYLATDR
jgi:hypothetical protein